MVTAMANHQHLSGFAALEKICRACARPFVVEPGEREFFVLRGLAEPRRCKPCRMAKRMRAGTRRPLMVSYGD